MARHQSPARSNSEDTASAPQRRKLLAKKIVNKVDELTQEAHRTLRDMLVTGATFEDAAEAVNDLGGDTITVRAVEKYFRSDLSVQTERIRRQLETARALKESLANPQSAQAELAEAVLITGLLGLRKREETSRLQRAVRVKDQHENHRLKTETLRLRSKKLDLDKRLLEARLSSETAKLELLRTKVIQLKRAADREGQGHSLGPETIQRIHEIYGLASIGAGEAAGSEPDAEG
ncbi:MAG: hypothetical protein ACRD10_07910 [Terriglobia bacterium]